MHCRSFDDRDVCTVRKIDARIAGDAMMVAGACARRQAATAGASSSATRQPARGARSISRAAALGTIAAAAPTESRSREICMREIARDGLDHAAPGPDAALT